LSLDDDVYKIFLNTQGDRHQVSKSLANLMDYINNNEPNDDFTRSLQEEVELQRDDDGKRALYMTYNQTLMEMEEKGKIKGREEGRAEGRAELAKAIKKIMENMKLPADKAMEMMGIAKEEYPKYMTLL
jgi:flagellar biosynthesis/type III secretory pathway protein FliH